MAILENNTQEETTTSLPYMTLLSGPGCLLSHSCNLVLLEKDVECNVEYTPKRAPSAKLNEHNPAYGETPTLIDRDIVLYDPRVITDYFDERFPHPPLLPADPISRAKTRLFISRMLRDWLYPISQLKGAKNKNWPVDLNKSIRDGLSALSPLFNQQPFFMGNEYTLADAYLIPLLWLLKRMEFKVPKQTTPLLAYSERMFKRDSFERSLLHPKSGLN